MCEDVKKQKDGEKKSWRGFELERVYKRQPRLDGFRRGMQRRSRKPGVVK